MKRFVSLSVLFVAFGSYACSSDSSPSTALTGPDGGPASGGASGGGGSDNGSGGAGTSGTAVGCDKVPAAHRVASVYGGAKSLRASGNNLFLFDKGDEGFPTALKRIDATSGTATTVRDAGLDCGPMGLALNKTDAFYFDDCSDGTATLQRVPMAGGTATPVYPVPNGNYGGLDVIQATDQYAYIYRVGDANDVIRRVTLADGSTMDIAKREGAFVNMQVLGTDVWFGARSSLDGVVHSPLDGSNPGGSPAIDLKGCVLTFSATNAGLFCSDPISLYQIGLNGQDRKAVFELPGGQVNVSLPDGDFIYLMPMGFPDKPAPLMKYPVKGGTPKVLACSKSVVTQLVFNDTTVFWLETDDNLNGVIYSAPK